MHPILPLSLSLSVLLLAALSACQQTGGPSRGVPGDLALPSARSALSVEDRLARGRELYLAHCEACHGSEGRGDGAAAAVLFPPARDFGEARFRLVSTENGVPTDADLVALLRRGMPGSAMPSWDWLPDEDLAILASQVRLLAREGLAERLVADAREHHGPMSDEEANAKAARMLTPGKSVRVVEGVEPTLDVLALGEALYLRDCAACHGIDGTSSSEPRFDDDGGLNWARDLTAGFLKGGASSQSLFLRIRAGMPGTAMPATRYDDPAETAALVEHVKTLLPAGTEDRLVMRRETLLARRVPGALSEDPGDAMWSQADAVDVVLAPLHWNDESVLLARLSALHDGERVGIRLSWVDETGDSQLFGDATRTDGAALQLSPAAAPPLFGMGSREHATTVWHWQSLRLDEVSGALDLLEPVPHLRADTELEDVRLDAPVYHRLEGVPPVSVRVDRLRPRGVDTARTTPRTRADVQVHPRRRGDRWEVLFVRSLQSSSAGDVDLLPGTAVQVACAIWNGAAGDERGRKSISIWNELRLAP